MPSPTDDLRSFFSSGSGSNADVDTASDVDASGGDRAATPNSLRDLSDRHRRGTQIDGEGGHRPSAEGFDLGGIAVADVVDNAADRADLRGAGDPVAMGPRSTITLQKAWIDPEETPFEPVARPGNPLAARLISWVAIVAFLCGLAWLILPELDVRLSSLETVELHEGVLTAQPVQLSSLRPAIVSELYVDASTLPDGVLEKGSTIALLEGRSEDGKRMVMSEVRAPFDARFVSIDTLVGGIVTPGTPVATVYDPSQMYVIITVQPELLDVMRRGMRANLHSDVAGVDIGGEVISAVPLLGTDHEPTTANLVNIRIKPDPGSVADLVPGIRFDAIIDLTSGAPDAQPLVFTNASHVKADRSSDSSANAAGNG